MTYFIHTVMFIAGVCTAFYFGKLAGRSETAEATFVEVWDMYDQATYGGKGFIGKCSPRIPSPPEIYLRACARIDRGI